MIGRHFKQLRIAQFLRISIGTVYRSVPGYPGTPLWNRRPPQPGLAQLCGHWQGAHDHALPSQLGRQRRRIVFRMTGKDKVRRRRAMIFWFNFTFNAQPPANASLPVSLRMSPK